MADTTPPPPPPPHRPSPSNHNAATASSATPQSSIAFTPRSTSIAEDSDTEFEPTPVHSPGGPQYDDLPPSYDEARLQAVQDARSGLLPLDPNEIEAHRLTLSEDPNGPEIWEYRVRGERSDPADELERAPDYGAHPSPLASTIPVQHVQASEDIPVGRIHGRSSTSNTSACSIETLLNAALQFARHEPDADVLHAPTLARCIAIPREDLPAHVRDTLDPEVNVRFVRAYAKALNAHSVRPAEFITFLDGLNALCSATGASEKELLGLTCTAHESANVIQRYLDGVNEAFFAPRGLRVSLRPLSQLLQSLDIPTAGHQHRDARLRIFEPASTAATRAQALHPWIEGLEFNVPEPSTQTITLLQMCTSYKKKNDAGHGSDFGNQDHEDPPHSVPDDTHQAQSRPGKATKLPSHNERLATYHHGRGGCGPQRTTRGRPEPPRSANEWAAFGQDMGKWGEDFGRRMGEWGQQFGQAASVWGQDIATRASGSGTHSFGASTTPSSQTTHQDEPPSYAAGQETGVALRDEKLSLKSPDISRQEQGKSKSDEMYEDDDSSSVSSDSSDSDSDFDSDSDSEDCPDTQAMFLKRMESIEKQAQQSAKKGKKSSEEISLERAAAIEVAQTEKAAMDKKYEAKLTKRAARKDLRCKGRELKKEHRQRKRELHAAQDRKGKGKAKKSKEWKDAKKEYRDKKKELRKEKIAARKEWRNEKNERRKERKEKKCKGQDGNEMVDIMVWIVIEDLGP